MELQRNKGSRKTVPEWADVESGIETTSTLDLANKVGWLEKNPYSIGYMDAGVGQSFTALVEVSLRNRAGKFLTSQESDVSAAALETTKLLKTKNAPRTSYNCSYSKGHHGLQSPLMTSQEIGGMQLCLVVLTVLFVKQDCQPSAPRRPIATMPMVFVRTDAIGMGATGA
eukprot:scaffold69231_cov20-Tisochrysis_lutea.AAC.1